MQQTGSGTICLEFTKHSTHASGNGAGGMVRAMEPLFWPPKDAPVPSQFCRRAENRSVAMCCYEDRSCHGGRGNTLPDGHKQAPSKKTKLVWGLKQEAAPSSEQPRSKKCLCRVGALGRQALGAASPAAKMRFL